MPKRKGRINCWEFMKCGREPGGDNPGAGVCPTAEAVSMNGINGGHNGGRICWLVSGTYGKRKAEFANCIEAKRLWSCMHCDFHGMVLEEEGFKISDEIISKKMRDGLSVSRSTGN